jgi:hypothetical protein
MESSIQNFKCFAYASNGQHPGLKRLRETAEKFLIDLETVGARNRSSGKVFRWQQKVEDFRQALHQKFRGDGLVLLCDGYDVRFLASSDEIISRYHELVPEGDKVVVCGERKYVHHHAKIPETTWLSTEGPYRYPSTCVMMGPRKLVMKMLDAIPLHRERNDRDHCRCGPRPFLPCDQSMIGLWLSRNRETFVIDTLGHLFWSTRGEHKEFMKKHATVIRMENGGRRLKNRNTNKLPCVIHVPVPVTLSSRVRR